MEEVRAIVDTESRNRIQAAALPVPVEHIEFEMNIEKGCQFAAPLHFTVTALEKQSFQTLFSNNWTARAIVGEWDSNTKRYENLDASIFRKLRESLSKLTAELNKTVYDDLLFSEMVDYRLHGTFPESMNALDNRISALLDAKFQFPLFDTSNPTPANIRMYLLKQFIPIRTSPTTGGLGNMTWGELYNTRSEKYDPVANTGFSDEVIYDLVVPMQGQLFPLISYDCDKTVDLAENNDKCCCNNSAHTGKYRKCSGYLQGANCDEFGGICNFLANYCSFSHPAH
jgi:hypothetical protein